MVRFLCGFCSHLDRGDDKNKIRFSQFIYLIVNTTLGLRGIKMDADKYFTYIPLSVTMPSLKDLAAKTFNMKQPRNLYEFRSAVGFSILTL